MFAFLRRIGRLYDISPVLIGEVSVHDYINSTTEMSSRIETVPVPRWQYDEAYLSLLDTLEAAVPLAHPSELSSERFARRIFAMSEGLIGETVKVIADAAIVAIGTGKERISLKTLQSLDHLPPSQRRRSSLREALL
ncbi:MAG: TniB family NTP-binding protein [Rhodoblastus sp.]|nr:TniB family NTP-binding protein [Rhodoblastus sp.]HRX73801.1 TniB family NTP-binding protein [Hyphomonas sp.]